MRRCKDAERVWENLDSRRCKDAKMRRCGEGLRKSGQPKMRRCKDAKMRRGFEKILTAEDAKMQRCDAAERVWEHLDSRRCEDAKMRCCGSPQNICRPNATKMRRCNDATMRGQGNVHPALPVYDFLEKNPEAFLPSYTPRFLLAFHFDHLFICFWRALLPLYIFEHCCLHKTQLKKHLGLHTPPEAIINAFIHTYISVCIS